MMCKCTIIIIIIIFIVNFKILVLRAKPNKTTDEMWQITVHNKTIRYGT